MRLDRHPVAIFLFHVSFPKGQWRLESAPIIPSRSRARVSRSFSPTGSSPPRFPPGRALGRYPRLHGSIFHVLTDAPDILFSRCCYVTPSLSFQKGGMFGNLFFKKSPDFFQNSFVPLPHRCVRDAENNADISRCPLLNIDQFNQEAFFVREYGQRVFQLAHLFPLQESIFR